MANQATYTIDHNANDYYLYMPCDCMLLMHNKTLAEVLECKAELDTEVPDEAGLSVVAKVSDDYKLAAERAFMHMLNW